MKKYEENNMKKYEGNMKKYEGITLLRFGPRDLKKFRACPAGRAEGSQNTNRGGRREKRRETCQSPSPNPQPVHPILFVDDLSLHICSSEGG